ncbi:alpha/beta hydrolase [Kibdelosporangium philippinense]|uniref:Alpha/beta hydrolase n=1 Tax=Kibdelosporangium philippinense TaxID=211113 RepID=A0ABS8ZX09_9PSEU|nr:alpha/beta hydrolase [Kibdelosporangium philippinense]MCE7011605.1 alpha/beta hydrolase [Kibdelosporangium philippinense]
MQVLAIPGTLCAPRVFDRLADRLEVAVTGVSWLTEPGQMDIPVVAERIVRRYPEPGLVLGHSTGGAIALYLAIKHPARVRGLMLVNTGAHTRGHGDIDRIVARVRDNWGPDLHAELIDRSFASPVDPVDRSELLTYAAAVPMAAVLAALRSQGELDFTPELAEIRCPVTVVHGVLDTARPVEHAKQLADGIPDAHLRLVRTGHTPVYEAPDALAAEVRALISRCAPGQSPAGPRHSGAG